MTFILILGGIIVYLFLSWLSLIIFMILVRWLEWFSNEEDYNRMSLDEISDPNFMAVVILLWWMILPLSIVFFILYIPYPMLLNKTQFHFIKKAVLLYPKTAFKVQNFLSPRNKK